MILFFQYQDKGSVPECVKRSKDMANIMDMVSMDTLVIIQEKHHMFHWPLNVCKANPLM